MFCSDISIGRFAVIDFLIGWEKVPILNEKYRSFYGWFTLQKTVVYVDITHD